jgi:hypothetical protein
MQQPSILQAITPVVFRMLERRWVDKFFETGELRLSSFAKFREHTDEQRSDNEGRHKYLLQGDESTGFAVVMGIGSDAYILCATTCEPSESLLQSFGGAAIKIFDTMAFGRAVSRCVPAFSAGYLGHCAYQRWIHAKVPNVTAESFGATSNTIDLNKAHEFLSDAAGAAVYFRKAPTPTFMQQAEYRWVFRTSSAVESTVTILAPEARKFCVPWYP